MRRGLLYNQLRKGEWFNVVSRERIPQLALTFCLESSKPSRVLLRGFYFILLTVQYRLFSSDRICLEFLRVCLLDYPKSALTNHSHRLQLGESGRTHDSQ